MKYAEVVAGAEWIVDRVGEGEELRENSFIIKFVTVTADCSEKDFEATTAAVERSSYAKQAKARVACNNTSAPPTCECAVRGTSTPELCNSILSEETVPTTARHKDSTRPASIAAALSGMGCLKQSEFPSDEFEMAVMKVFTR